MSRAYRIRVSESLTRTLRAEDSISTQIELLEVLPASEMTELLSDELKRRGYVEVEGKLVRREGGVATEVDPKTGTVTVRAKSEQKEEVRAEQEGYAYDDIGPSEATVKEGLRRQLQQTLQKAADQAEAKLQKDTTERLEGALSGLQQELNQAVNRVTAEALKKKAAQIGQIKQVTEDSQTGSLTITVEV
ncbi:MAG: hypothetical protein U0746_01215 [Gemmataceae bacterium]